MGLFKKQSGLKKTQNMTQLDAVCKELTSNVIVIKVGWKKTDGKRYRHKF